VSIDCHFGGESQLSRARVGLAAVSGGDRWLADGSDATTVLEHKLCGHSVEPVLVCAACRGDLRRDSMTRADR
jgi:hypothetical protein